MLITTKDNQNHDVTYEVDFESENVELGYGGTGKVFRGVRTDSESGIKRDVAIKFLYDDLPQTIIERARRESEIRIKSDNLVEMIDFVEVIDEKGKKHFHVVSELLEGVLLSELLIGHLESQDGKIYDEIESLYRMYQSKPNKFAVKIIRSVLSGIMSMHDAGYIHRDIDPSNIMITNNGNIKLLDFGIAKKLNADDIFYQRLTMTGEFVGKASYAAPELVTGDLAHQNLTTDLYAIGILFYELVVGQLPFDGPAHEVLKKQLNDDIPSKKILNKHIRKIIEKATQKEQAKRYQSAFEFRVALDQMPNADTVFHDVKWIWMGGVAAVAGFGLGVLIHFLI